MTFWHKIWSKICIPYSLYSNFLCLVHFIYTNYRLNDVHFEIFRLHKVMSLFWRVLLNSKECFQQTFRIEMKCKYKSKPCKDAIFAQKSNKWNWPRFAITSLMKSIHVTAKSLWEALIFASTNPQNDNRLFIELQVQYMKIPSSNLGRTCCVQKLFCISETISVHNIFSPDLSLEFSCIELVIQWTICRHIVG